jgi:hypothetical protein
MQWRFVPRLWIPCEHPGIKSRTQQHLQDADNLRHGHCRAFRRNCRYPRFHPKGLGVDHHHAKPMEKVLASRERRDLLLRVGAPFQSLQGGRDVRYHSTLPRGTSDRYLGACNPVRKMVARSLYDAGKNSRGNIGFKIKGNTSDGGRLQRN